MDRSCLNDRAVPFALFTGAISFALALIAVPPYADRWPHIAIAALLAIVCGLLSWGAAKAAITEMEEAIEAIAGRIGAAAQGDLFSPAPPGAVDKLPELALAVEGLFSQIRSNLDSVHALAMFDSVTGLPNRVHFRREADRLLGLLRPDGVSALLFIDLDRFKFVNDNLGHASGDELLVLVASRLSEVVGAQGKKRRATDLMPVVARLAGDEFTLFFPMVGDEAHAMLIARQTLSALAEPFPVAGQMLDVGASIGVAISPEHGRDLTTLMRAADIAMYHAKAQGRGQAQLFTTHLAAAVDDRLRLDIELRRALERNEFELAFQPQLELATGEIVAIEALIRWRHPVDGLRLPGSFLPAAEESGLVCEIGDWVIGEAMRTLAGWQAARHAIRLTVNLSPRQIDRPDFFSRLRGAIAESGARADLVEIEIAETSAMRCSAPVLAGISALRREGIRIAIDDFGTGYSNFARLREMPLDRVKLDRSLIAEVTRCETTRTVAHSVINLLHGLGFETVAEGVEEQGQIDVLRAMGCDVIQGYAIAPPMTEPAFLKWLEGHKASRQSA